jgi:hypothetical protein
VRTLPATPATVAAPVRRPSRCLRGARCRGVAALRAISSQLSRCRRRGDFMRTSTKRPQPLAAQLEVEMSLAQAGMRIAFGDPLAAVPDVDVARAVVPGGMSPWKPAYATG